MANNSKMNNGSKPNNVANSGAMKNNNNSGFVGKITSFFTGSSEANPMEEYLKDCKDQVKGNLQSSMQHLSDEDYQEIDALLRQFPTLIREFKKHANQVSKNVDSLDVESATELMKSAKRFFEDDKTMVMMDNIIDKYGVMIENEDTWRAIGNYVKCVLGKMDDKYKRLALATFEAFMAFFSLVRKDERARKFASNVTQRVRDNVAAPATNTLTGGAYKMKRTHGASSSSSSTASRRTPHANNNNNHSSPRRKRMSSSSSSGARSSSSRGGGNGNGSMREMKDGSKQQNRSVHVKKSTHKKM